MTTKFLFAILTIAMITAACGGSDATPPVAAAAPESAPAAPAAAPAIPAEVAPAPPPAAPRPRKRTSNAPEKVSARRTEAPAPARAAAPAAREVSSARVMPEYREYTLPAGTMLPLELKSAIASDVSQVEDAVRATLRQPITVDGRRVLPAGIDVAGIVTVAERAGRVKGRSRIAFQFTTLRHDGERHRIETDPIEQMGEATKGEDATKVGAGAGAGAIIGGILGGKTGAAKGAAIGAGAGTGAVLATRGNEVSLEAGAQIEARLAAPLTIQVRVR